MSGAAVTETDGGPGRGATGPLTAHHKTCRHHQPDDTSREPIVRRFTVTPAAGILGVAALLILLWTAATSAADDLFIECEEFEAYGANDLGGYPIGIEYCSGASQFQAVFGLDLPGEWIRLKVSFTQAGCYRASMGYQAAYGETVDFRVRMVDAPEPGDETDSPFVFDDGYGFG